MCTHKIFVCAGWWDWMYYWLYGHSSHVGLCSPVSPLICAGRFVMKRGSSAADGLKNEEIIEVEDGHV